MAVENLLNHLASQRHPILLRYAVTTIIVGVFFLIRVAMAERAGTYGFFVFIPAVFLTALMFDRGSGLYATALCTLCVIYLLEPSWEIEAARNHWIPVVFFAGECVGIAVLCEALRRALERATRAEREKDLLFKELGHRIKNNLQMITSVLGLQARTQTDPDVRLAFGEAVSRVHVIAQVHDRLQPDGHEGSINLRDYIEDLCSGLGDHLRDVRPVAVRVDVEPIVTGADKAVPIGLIVNELVTNAFKYAFPDDMEGAVSVTLHRMSGNEVELTVRDNGIGLTTDREGLGTRLVKLLVQQLGGSLRRDSGKPGCTVAARLTL